MSEVEADVSLLSRVFISYAHDDAAHEERVRKLWVFLRKQGIDAHIDLSAAEQPQDWPTWMRAQLRAARFVLLIASPAYRQRAEGDASPDVGRGVRWEAGLIRDEFYADPDAARRRFLPVILPGGSANDIPDWVGRASGTHYNVASYTVKGSERLLRLLTDQPHEIEPPLGKIPLLPKRGASGPAIRGDRQVAGLVRRMANRVPDRDETMVQADVRQLLLMGSLGLDEYSLGAEATTRPDDRRRIVVERGATIIEVRNGLRKREVLQAAEHELAAAVQARASLTGRRYATLLTDGADWRLYHQNGDLIDLVAELTVDASGRDASQLLSWLEAILATGKRIEPTPAEISRKLGADSPAHAYDVAELSAIYNRYRHLPTVQVKRSLWGRLLKTAQGTNFTDDDELFINHTLLVIMAEVIGHAVIGIDLDDPGLDAGAIMSGVRFSDAQVRGVVEADFFDWVAEVPGGEKFVMSLVGRLTRFAWDRVEHDVMKILYESIISRESRHRLGEYYTPGWLADEVIASTIGDPLSQRVLDASCGSGTFLFHAIRQYLAAADAAGLPGPQAIRGVVSHILGIDVHPVAVTLARVTYLLAIGEARLQASDRPPLSVPVYLGDSLQWGQESSLLSYAGLGVPIDSDFELFTDRLDVTDQLRFPDSVIADAEQFDLLVSELARLATRRVRGARVPSLARVFSSFSIQDEDQPTLSKTFRRMCELHDEEKDHIWGYYVRNLARPSWFARSDNQVDILIGNPPWLAYRFMTEPQKRTFRVMSTERGLWAAAALATQQDLSALFVSRCIELYLRPGGRFGYVMPGAVLSRGQYAGFRSGRLGSPGQEVDVSFDKAWDLHQIKPSFFKVPACVVSGERRAGRGGPSALEAAAEIWIGRFDTEHATRTEAAEHITRLAGEPSVKQAFLPSKYASRFGNGATVFPRVLLIVEQDTISPLGTGHGRMAVRSRRSPFEKAPWKILDPLRGIVESEFIRPLYLGESILPYRPLSPHQAVIPWSGDHLMHGNDELIDAYPGLAQWWRDAEEAWLQNRSSERLSLAEQLDYRHKLSRQFPVAGHRVVYTKSGMYLAAGIIADTSAIIDHKLYWAPFATLDEARFLTAILNSSVLTMAVRPLQARGEHNPRDFDKHVFQLPIPLYDLADSRHRRLVNLAEQAEVVAANVDLPASRFETQRRKVREALDATGIAAEIDAGVKTLLGRHLQ